MGKKFVVVMRLKYPDGRGGTMKPRTGKLIAQGMHAVTKLFKDRLNAAMKDSRGPECFMDESGSFDFLGFLGIPEIMWEWLNSHEPKIVLKVNSEQELMNIHQDAINANIESHLIRDLGLTEFDGPQFTCVGIGPGEAETIDAITGHLEPA